MVAPKSSRRWGPGFVGTWPFGSPSVLEDLHAFREGLCKVSFRKNAADTRAGLRLRLGREYDRELRSRSLKEQRSTKRRDDGHR